MPEWTAFSTTCLFLVGRDIWREAIPSPLCQLQWVDSKHCFQENSLWQKCLQENPPIISWTYGEYRSKYLDILLSYILLLTINLGISQVVDGLSPLGQALPTQVKPHMKCVFMVITDNAKFKAYNKHKTQRLFIVVTCKTQPDFK